MHFSELFDSILNEKWLFSSRNNDISGTHARGHALQRENLETYAIWCVLVYVLIGFCIKIVFFKVISLYRTI